MMMKTNTQLLKVAKQYIDEGGARFRKFCGLPKGAPYCNAFVDYVAFEGGDASLFFDGKKITYCPTSIKWCYKNLACIPLYLAMPMDLIFFDWEENGDPNHIGFVHRRKSAEEIYTIEGNTTKTDEDNHILATGVVAYKTRTLYNKKRTIKYIQGVFRPHFPAKYDANKKLVVDGKCGYNTIAIMQKWLNVKVDGILGLGTLKTLQKKLGVKADGIWGKGTSKTLQRLIGVKDDGYFGENSVKALQTYLNRQVFEPKPQPKPTTNKDKLVSTARSLAWAKGTAKSKYAWKGGRATDAFKTALNKAYPKRSNWSKAPKAGCCCDVFVGTVVRASGLDSKFPRGWGEQIKHKSDKFEKLTYTNANPYSVSKDGDIILYTKNKSGSSKHVLMRGDGVIYEAQYEKTYGHVNASVKKKLNVKRPKVVIFRAK